MAGLLFSLDYFLETTWAIMSHVYIIIKIAPVPLSYYDFLPFIFILFLKWLITRKSQFILVFVCWVLILDPRCNSDSNSCMIAVTQRIGAHFSNLQVTAIFPWSELICCVDRQRSSQMQFFKHMVSGSAVGRLTADGTVTTAEVRWHFQSCVFVTGGSGQWGSSPHHSLLRLGSLVRPCLQVPCRFLRSCLGVPSATATLMSPG